MCWSFNNRARDFAIDKLSLSQKGNVIILAKMSERYVCVTKHRKWGNFSLQVDSLIDSYDTLAVCKLSGESAVRVGQVGVEPRAAGNRESRTVTIKNLKVVDNRTTYCTKTQGFVKMVHLKGNVVPEVDDPRRMWTCWLVQMFLKPRCTKNAQRESRRTVCCLHLSGLGWALTSRCCKLLKLTEIEREFCETWQWTVRSADAAVS